MKQHKKILEKYSIEKAENSLKSCELNIQNNLFTEAQNRAYYSIFYIVLALAYMQNFVTGKHHQLMGWFNKKYIHENKIFDKKFSKIYQRLLLNRQKFDYDVSKFPEKEQTIQDFEYAQFFVNEVKKYILINLQEQSNNKV